MHYIIFTIQTIPYLFTIKPHNTACLQATEHSIYSSNGYSLSMRDASENAYTDVVYEMNKHIYISVVYPEEEHIRFL
jgi:hypothetical protein